MYSKNNDNFDNYCAKVFGGMPKKSKAKLDQVSELSLSCCNWKIPKVFPKKICSVWRRSCLPSF